MQRSLPERELLTIPLVEEDSARCLKKSKKRKHTSMNI
jgi:hypothetical protein